MKKVLFITYGGGHVNIAIPIIKKLANSQGIEPVVIALTTAAITLKKHNISFFRLMDFFEDKEKEKIQLIGRSFLKEHHNFYAGLDELDTIAYMGTCYYDLLQKYGEEEAAKKFEINGRKSFFPTEVMKKIYSKIDPDLVITTSGQRTEGAAVFVAQHMNIPTLRIVDLFGNTGTLPQGDFIAVINEYAKQCLVKRGISEDKIFITGQPAFETLFTKTREDQQKLLEELNIQNKFSTLVTYASQKTPEDREVLIEILETFKKLKNHQLIIKLHPSEDGVMQKSLCSSYNLANVKIVRDADTQTLLSMSDIILTQFSTCGLEAILLDKRLITINFSNKPDVIPYAPMGAALGVYHGGDLLNALESIELEDVKRELKRGRQLFWMNNCPTQEIADLIQKILTI
ncbi:TPA: UDP-N-acetylglucosamine 2-epimerase [Bacillus cereus]